MDVLTRIETGLGEAIALVATPEAPPGLLAATRHAVFPGGARIRPRLCLAVARACGDEESALAGGAATAIEFLHCASLVHDDLPCFDDAAMRRGRPSVHAAFGAPLAVLAGDALIVLAFDVLARTGAQSPSRLPAVLGAVARAVGLPGGIAAGQAWECERECGLVEYQRAKTGALFVAATTAGAMAAGADPAPWHALGASLGEAYQVADDLRDVCADVDEIGKPTGRDALLGRPSAVAERGVAGALRTLEDLVGRALDSIPACDGSAELQGLVVAEARRLKPQRLLRVA